MEWASMTDTSLVVAIGRWRQPALAEIYRRHGGSVHALARRVLGDARADDVTQEVFVAIWDHPERFEAERGGLRSYLLTLAHSRAVDVLRADGARAAREERSARDTATAGYDLENQVWDLAMADAVKAAVDALPDGERQAIEMAYFGGHTYRQVASLLGEAEGTVKSRIRSGLARLRRNLAQSGMAPVAER